MRALVRLACVLGPVTAFSACTAILGDFTVGTVPVGNDAGDAGNDVGFDTTADSPSVDDASDTGTPDVSPDVSPPPPGPSILSVAAGNGHTCAMVHYDALGKSEAWCWGNNGAGQLGNGPTTSGFTLLATQGQTFRMQSSSGANHTCALDPNGDVWCWGDDSSWQSGGSTGNQVQTPKVVSTGYANHSELAVGDKFSCVLAGNKTTCWGDNANCIVDPTCTGRSLPNGGAAGDFGAINVTPQKMLTAGSGFACIYAMQGSQFFPFCWGNNNSYRIKNAAASSYGSAQLEPYTNLSLMGLGESQACVLAGNTFYCWGANGAGQANGNPANPGVIDPATAPAVNVPGGTPVAIAGGTGVTCAIGGDRLLRCWGANYKGQLGIGSLAATPGFVQVKDLKDVQSVALGGLHACAVAHSGSQVSSDPYDLYCWGDNTSRQVDPNAQPQQPVTVPKRIVFPPYQ